MKYHQITDTDISNLQNMVSSDRFICPAGKHYDHDQFKDITSEPDLAMQPVTNAEVSEIMKYANEHSIPVTVRGNSTGLMGANIAAEHGIALDMIKMNKILSYEPESLTLTVQAGVRIRDIDEFLADKPFIYVPAPAMQWAAIGGNVNTNAGGLKAVRYGTTREHIRSLTVILADGTKLKCGHKTVKNCSGYNIKDIVIGSEGTLGVVTEVVLRLIPRAKIEKNALVAFNDMQAAIKTVPQIFAAGLTPTSLEYFSQEDVDLWEKYAKKTFPVKAGSGYLMISFDGDNDSEVDRQLNAALKVMQENGSTKQVILTADNPDTELIWTAREAFLLAIQASTRKMDEVDISVPINKIPVVLSNVERIAKEQAIRLPNFGHAGDGNLHIYICSDEYSDDEFATKKDQVIRSLYQVAKDCDGEMSGEHGIGYARADYFEDFYGKDYVKLLQRIKRAFDPNLILNPDKIFPMDN